jgi:RiboL-PSP-HEPN
MSAKSELLARLQYVNSALNLPTLIDNGIVPNEHNGVANLLRKGLAIVAFNILEDFIKNKSIESLNFLSTSRIQFANLTESLKVSSITGALNSLNYHSGILKKDGISDWKTIVQDEALKIHSTKNNVFELSKYTLVYSGSNVSHDEVNEFIKAFGIPGGWTLLKSISDKIGGGLPDLAQAYKNAANRRNSSAHEANFEYNHVWLANLKNEILAIAASLDIVITARCRQVQANPAMKLDDHNIQDALNFRFLEQFNSIYKETRHINGRSRKNWPQLSVALNNIQPSLVGRNEFLIILNSMGRIEDWYS